MTISRAEIDDLNDGDMVTVAGWQGLRVSGPVTVGDEGVYLGDHIPIFYGSMHDPFPDWTQEFGSTLQIIKRAEPKPPPLYGNHPRTEVAPGDIVVRHESESVWVRTTDDKWINWRGQVWSKLTGPLTLIFDGARHEVVR